MGHTTVYDLTDHQARFHARESQGLATPNSIAYSEFYGALTFPGRRLSWP
jgi:hypothetical protein